MVSLPGIEFTTSSFLFFFHRTKLQRAYRPIMRPNGRRCTAASERTRQERFVPLTGQSVSRTASFSRDFRAIQRAPCLTYTEAWPGLTFFLARDEIAIDARDNAPRGNLAAS